MESKVKDKLLMKDSFSESTKLEVDYYLQYLSKLETQLNQIYSDNLFNKTEEM